MMPEPPQQGPEFAAAAEYLRRLAETISRYPAFRSPAKSRARREAADRSFDGEWGRATFELLHEPVVRLTIALDHLRALAAVTEEPGAALAIATLVRPPLEALGSLWWLYAPDADVRERVQRRYNLRLASLVEQWAITAVTNPAATRKTENLIDEISRTAHGLGFDFTARNSRYDNLLGARFLGAKGVPSSSQLIESVLDLDEDDLARMVFRLTSAVIHGQAHAIVPFMVERGTPDVEGLTATAIGLRFRMYATLTGSVVLASNSTMRRLIAHFGWSSGPWDQVAQPALIQWRDWLN